MLAAVAGQARGGQSEGKFHSHSTPEMATLVCDMTADTPGPTRKKRGKKVEHKAPPPSAADHGQGLAAGEGPVDAERAYRVAQIAATLLSARVKGDSLHLRGMTWVTSIGTRSPTVRWSVRSCFC